MDFWLILGNTNKNGGRRTHLRRNYNYKPDSRANADTQYRSHPMEKIDVTPSPITAVSTSFVSLDPPGPIRNLRNSDPLWKLVKAAYITLNQTNPEATRSCWLCYNLYPPYYEAVGLNASYGLTDSIDPPQCRWANQRDDNSGQSEG